MKIDLELKELVKDYIRTANRYCTCEEILSWIGVTGSRVYLSYRGIDVTSLNKECGFIRRVKSNRLLSKIPNISKEDLLIKMKTIIKTEAKYIHRSDFHTKFKIWSDLITYYDIDVHTLNLELGYYKDSPMSKLNKVELEILIKSYILKEQRYISQQEIVEVFNISLAFLTQGNIDTIRMNADEGYGNDYSYFELKVLNVLKRYYSNIVSEKTFDDCRSLKGFLLRYDFFIDNILIEADGSHHWDINHKFNNESVISNDNIKNEYAKNKEFYLIRIPYPGRNKSTETYVETILLENLKSLVTTAGLEITNVKVRKALGLDNQQPSL